MNTKVRPKFSLKIKPGLTAHLTANRLGIHKALYELMGRPRKVTMEFFGRGELHLYPSPSGVHVLKSPDGSVCIRPRSYVWTPKMGTFFTLSAQVGERVKMVAVTR